MDGMRTRAAARAAAASLASGWNIQRSYLFARSALPLRTSPLAAWQQTYQHQKTSGKQQLLARRLSASVVSWHINAASGRGGCALAIPARTNRRQAFFLYCELKTLEVGEHVFSLLISCSVAAWLREGKQRRTLFCAPASITHLRLRKRFAGVRRRDEGMACEIARHVPLRASAAKLKNAYRRQRGA